MVQALYHVKRKNTSGCYESLTTLIALRFISPVRPTKLFGRNFFGLK